MRNALILVGLTLTLIACSALSAPTLVPTAIPSPSPSVTAEPTLSPTTIPTATREPTETAAASPAPNPELIELFTPTGTVPPPSPTATVPLELDCRLNWQSPGNGITYKPDIAFSAGWNVTNTGSAAWNPSAVEFAYFGGAKMYDYPVVNLDKSVSPGQTAILSVHMRAPATSSTYTTYWSLRKGNTFFCRVRLSIFVQ